MKVKQTIEKIPGGMMIVPLISGTLINSFWPELLNIGGFTTGLADGATPLIGAFLFCMGAGIRFRSAPKSAKKGISVTACKFLVGMAVGIAVGYWAGPQGVFGLSSLAIISAMTNTNGGLYAALVGEFGDETDIGAIAFISINDGPFLTMIALGTSGLASFPIMDIIGVVLPLFAGMVLGNLDEEFRSFLTKGGMVLIPFFAFSLGCGLEINMLLEAGLPGVLLGLVTVFVGGFFNIYADRGVGGTGICGASASSTAGNAVATPAAVALADPSLQSLVGIATSQLAAATITSAIFTPILVALVAKKMTGPRKERRPELS